MYATVDAVQIYAKTKSALKLKLKISAPSISATTKSTQPPNNCEIPVTQNAEFVVSTFLLIILATTVQNDAPIIKISPLALQKRYK